ncbi:MAG: universal stress protein [Gammaproteobacteria bacterium]
MRKPKRILSVLDPLIGAHTVEPALARGAFFARETGARLELFAALNQQAGPIARAEQPSLESVIPWLKELAGPLIRSGLSVSVDALWSRHTYDAIMTKIAALQPDLVIKATQHDSTLRRTLFNYTDWHLIRHCSAPLLLAKKECDWQSRRVLACVDPSHPHSSAETLDYEIIEAAHLLAYQTRGELHVFHAIEPIARPLTKPEQLYEEHRELLGGLIRPYGVSEQRLHIVHGQPTHTLLPVVEQLGADLVVMGAVSKGTLETLFVGHTAEKILDDLHCDILVVKSLPLKLEDTVTSPCPV